MDALGSERDEPCSTGQRAARRPGPNVYYFYELYADQAALDKHRAMPHYKTCRPSRHWRAPPSPPAGTTVFPADEGY